MHYQAWLNRDVTLTKTVGTGKSAKTEFIYKDFNKYFKRDEVLESLEIVEPKIEKSKKGLWSLVAKANRSSKKKGG